MKRKNWRVNSGHTSRVWPSSRKGSHGGFIGSKSRLNDSESPGTQGVGCNKRVKFTDLDGSKADESASVPQERIQDPRSGEPKTSEYASFKKLRDDAHRFQSHPLHQDKTQSTNLKASDCSRAGDSKTSEYASFKKLKEDAHRFQSHPLHQDKTQSTNLKASHAYTTHERRTVENRDKDLRPPLPKNVTPDNVSPCTSTPDNASWKSEIDMKRAGTTTTDMCKLQENMDRYGEPNEGVFSRKRHKLSQLVAKTLSVEADKLSSKGHDIVSVLLRKLFPESNKNKTFEGLMTETLGTDTKSGSFTSPEFDVHNKSQGTPARNFMELECGPSMDVGFSSCWPEIRRRKELPKPNFLNCYTYGTFLDNRVLEHEYERATPFLLTEGDSALGLDIKKREHLTSIHLKEVDEFDCSIKPLCRQGPQIHLLGWDGDNMVDERNLSTVPQNTELSLHPFPSSLYGVDQQRSLHDSFTANGFHYPIKPLHGRETQSLLLGWDADNIVDKSNLSTASQSTELSFNFFQSSPHGDDLEKDFDDSFTESRLRTESLVSYHPPTSQNTELSSNCFLSSLHGDDQKENLDDSFAESRLCTESFVPYHPPDLLSLQFSSSASNKSHAKDDIFADNNFSSSLSDMTNRPNMTTSSNYGITCNGSDTFLSPLNQPWFIKKILNEREHFPDKALSSAGFYFCMEPTCKPVSRSSSEHGLYACHALECPHSENLSSYRIGDDAKGNCDLSDLGISKHSFEDVIDTRNWSSNYFQIALDKEENCDLSHIGISKHSFEDVIDTRNRPSNYFQIALDKEKSYPLLLDKSYWDEPCGEKYSDEDELNF